MPRRGNKVARLIPGTTHASPVDDHAVYRPLGLGKREFWGDLRDVGGRYPDHVRDGTSP